MKNCNFSMFKKGFPQVDYNYKQSTTAFIRLFADNHREHFSLFKIIVDGLKQKVATSH